MADPRGKVTLKAGTKTFTLRLPINSVCDMEQDFSDARGVDMDCVQIGMKLEGANFRAIRKVLFHALAADWKPANGDLTEERVGEVMETAGIAAAAKAVGEVWRVTFPQPEAADRVDQAAGGQAEGEAGNGDAK